MSQITPTVGRVVLYHPVPADGQAPDTLCALVAAVHSPECLTLCVVHPSGGTFPANEVRHADLAERHGDHAAPCEPCWEWMPYQIGQAAKSEAGIAEQVKAEVERQLAEALERLQAAAHPVG